jgi:hypothetical protein
MVNFPEHFERYSAVTGRRASALAAHSPQFPAQFLQLDHPNVYAVTRDATRPPCPGLVQQTDQISASRDLSLIVRPHFRQSSRCQSLES